MIPERTSQADLGRYLELNNYCSSESTSRHGRHDRSTNDLSDSVFMRAPQTSESKSNSKSKSGSNRKYRNISFAGCGFMSIYHIGAASAIREFSLDFFKSCDKIYGCSAGSLVATALLTDFSLARACQTCLDIVDEATKRPLGPFNPRFKLNSILRASLEELCPDDIHLLANDKVFISLTRVKDRKNVIVSKYPSRSDYIDALIHSWQSLF